MQTLPDVAKILSGDPETLRQVSGTAAQFAIKLLVAGLILAATIWLSGFVSRLVRRGISRLSRKHPVDSTLPVFIGSVARYAIFIIGLIAVFQQLGVQTTSIIAVLGAASLAIGLALQGTLANVAAGVMLLILRPYRLGDTVEITGKQGKVRALDLFTTELTSLDGLRMVIPNSKVLGELIINYSTRGQRRFEISVGIDYADDSDKAIALLLSCAEADERVLKDPKPWAKVTALGDNAVVVTLRAWVKPVDYADTWPDMMNAIKKTFDGEGLRFPYPHQVEVPFEVAHPHQAAAWAARQAAREETEPRAPRQRTAS